MGFVLKALISAHKVELIRIFLTESRQDGDLFRIKISFSHDLRIKLINHSYPNSPQSALGAHKMDGSSEF